jgi:nucleoid DNA-binding protein
MSRALISGVIQRTAQVTDEVANRATGALLDAIANELEKAGEFTLPNIGTFNIQNKTVGTVSRTISRFITRGKKESQRHWRGIPPDQLEVLYEPGAPKGEKPPPKELAVSGTPVREGGNLGRTLLAVLSRWNIPDDQGTIILGSADTCFMAGLRSGEASLDTRDMQDRARLLFDIYEGVYGLLQNPQVERGWIRAPRPEFEGLSVLDLMTEGSQRNLIRALGFVDYVNGR